MKKAIILMVMLLTAGLVFAQVQPSASYTFYPKSVKTGELVYFYGNTSYDTNGTIKEYLWDFGDGTTAAGSLVTHEFSKVDNYAVTLTVIDDEGLSAVHTQHVAVPLKGTGSMEPGNLEFETGIEDFSTLTGTVSLSTEQAYIGKSSLKWDLIASAAGNVEVAVDKDLGILKGSEVIFRVWVPDAAPINSVQPFVLVHNADWTFTRWHGAWKSYDSLKKNAWNEFSLKLAADLPDGLIHKLGVQADAAAALDLDLYIDSIDWPDEGSGGQQEINFDFEITTEGFLATNGTLSLADMAYTGKKSLKWDASVTEAGVIEIYIDKALGIINGSKVFFQVFIPENAAIDWVQPFVLAHDADFTFQKWHGDWKSYSTLVKNQWNEFSITLDSDMPLNLLHKIGVQISANAAQDFTVYVDSIDWGEGSVPPYASFDYNIDRPIVGESIAFAASGNANNDFNAHDVDGVIQEFSWDFGDGSTANGSNVTHAYTKAGKYPVTLTVTDNDGFKHSLVRMIWCEQEELVFAPPLRVEGVHIIDSLGKIIVPQGLAVIDTSTFTKDDFQYLKKEWHIQIMRLPLITGRWYYVGPEAREAYLSVIDQYLDWTKELGIYVLFDGWHEGGQGNELEEWQACKDAWHILMQRYADRDHVLWETFNEPHHTTWEQWAAMNEELIDIIRSYNPVVKACGVPGVVWAQKLDVHNRPIERDQVFYMVHPYPHVYGAEWTVERWDEEFGYIIKEGIAPVLNSEYNYPLFNAGNREYGEKILKYMDMRNMGFTGWIYGGWEGPEKSNPKVDLTDGFRMFWEYFNGVWSPDYHLKVTGGTGSGAYKAGDPVEISGQKPVVSENEIAVFDGWTGDVQYLADPAAETTVLTIPKADISVQANYIIVDQSITIEYQTSQWSVGFITTIIISNNSGEDITGWQLAFTFEMDNEITQSWTCDYVQTGKDVVLTNLDYNAGIKNGKNITFGFLGKKNDQNKIPQRFKLNGKYIKIVE